MALEVIGVKNDDCGGMNSCGKMIVRHCIGSVRLTNLLTDGDGVRDEEGVEAKRSEIYRGC